MRIHNEDGSQCAGETCGGASYDPCNYTVEDARQWCKSVYIVGGAGTGKSTFMDQLMDRVVMQYGPLEDLHSLPNKKALVTLRGHRLNSYRGKEDGLYLGCIRPEFPGTDGLDRASSPVGEKWLQGNFTDLPGFIISEGATLATRRFIGALVSYTDLLLVHLHASPEVVQGRFEKRGSNQKPTFVANTVTRSFNLYTSFRGSCEAISIDTGDPDAWDLGLDLVASHVE